MFGPYQFKDLIGWRLVRAHLCTLAVAVGSNSTWRIPREAFRYGALQYGLAVTCAMLLVTPPIVLLQLAIGQLSQQDAVGVWRAVPFFRGVGYLRVLVSILGLVYSVVYLAIAYSWLLYISSNSKQPLESSTLLSPDDSVEVTSNSTMGLHDVLMEPVSSSPEFYLAVALIIVFMWIMLPFLFYHPVKLMRRSFFVLGPTVVVLAIAIVSSIAGGGNLKAFTNRSNWSSFKEAGIWHGALAQALLSSQIAGGYLIAAGDTIYSSTNVQWTTLVIVAANIFCSWMGLIFWFAISDGEKDASVVAVLVEAYNVGNRVGFAWSSVILAMLLLAGLISVLSFAYPVYERLRRLGRARWRVLSMVASLVGAGLSLAALAGRLPALEALDEVAVPLLASLATVLELTAFVFIYGWKSLIEDVEFLTGNALNKYWVFGWCIAPAIITPFTLWWLALTFLGVDWADPTWDVITVVATAAIICLTLTVCAGIAVAKQLQYGFIGKLKSSFQPSRHWGPRDPITHYYWLARRDEADWGDLMRTRYQRRELGQLSGRPSFLSGSVAAAEEARDDKKRSHSDDFLYTIYRKKILRFHLLIDSRSRSKSLDLTSVDEKSKVHLETLNISSFISEADPKASNTNVVTR